MGHDERGIGTEFNCKIAIANGIERVFADLFKSQQLGNQLAVNGIRGSCQGCGPEWEAVDPFSAVMHPFGISTQLLDIGHQMVAKSHGLGDLKVGKSGHDRVDVLLRQIDQGALELNEPVLGLINALAQPKSEVGGDLVITRTTRMEALTGIANQSGQTGFDIEMDVL
jgi:hypothetical protein